MNKFLIPAMLVATVVIAGIFAFMPVEKASTVHGNLATTASQTTNTNTITTNTDSEIDAQDRAMFFQFNQSLGSAFSSQGITLIPAKAGKTITGSYVLSATPNNRTAQGANNAQLECGLVDTTGGTGGTALVSNTNASRGTPASDILQNLVAGEGIRMQIETSAGSNTGGICEVTLFIDSNSDE